MSNYLEIDSKILEKNLLLKNDSEADSLENFFRSPENYMKENAAWKLVTPTAGPFRKHMQHMGLFQEEPVCCLCLEDKKTAEYILTQEIPVIRFHADTHPHTTSLDIVHKILELIRGFCVKTTDSKNKKVFINICKLDDIPEPRDVTEEELLELWQSDNPDFRIPLSIQEPHDEFDKSGNPTVAYDVAVNTKFFQKIQSNMVFRSFVLQVVMEGIENKYDVELKKEGYVILQNKKRLGELKPHRIRKSKLPGGPSKPLIEELQSTNTPAGSGDDIKTLRRTPEFRLFQNTKCNLLVGEFHLPHLVTQQDLTLYVNEDRIVLDHRRGSYFADFFIPVKIDETESTSFFNTTTKILTVKMPIISSA